nr:hypothetical protein PsAHV6-004 [Psittacid alphaherpesvirus 6]
MCAIHIDANKTDVFYYLVVHMRCLSNTPNLHIRFYTQPLHKRFVAGPIISFGPKFTFHFWSSRERYRHHGQIQRRLADCRYPMPTRLRRFVWSTVWTVALESPCAYISM